MDPRFLTLGESLATLFTSAFANARGERGSDAHPEVATNASPDTNSEAGSDFYMDIYPDIDSDDSESDNESDSSSVVYEHESFATFQSRVLEFALKFWPDAAHADITVDRLLGGGYNRIIGITRRSTKPHQAGEPSSSAATNVQCILRIPRLDSANVGNDVAALRFVHRYTTIPIPKVIQWDETDQNELGSAYQIQNRIPGTTLLSTYADLSHAQRCKLAHELGTICADMLAVKSSTAGRFVLPSEENCQKAQEPQVNIVSLCHHEDAESKPFSSSAATTPVLELLTSGLQENRDDLFTDRFMAMASELNEGGWLVNDHYSLAHLDFHPRNIHVSPTSDMQLPIISGILDWDSAILAPKFVTCRPPLWLWAWTDDEDEDERTADDEPPTPELRELKRLFEEAAGLEFEQFAYQPAFRLARQLFHFALNGVHSNEEFKEATAMLQEWQSVRLQRGWVLLPESR
ncbi:hypothetical protein F5X97DRAFT_336852 [Nemania serpens]|nr:hypothetical protein F5X97DRAFT_336852 [Nemania serpens]